MKYFAHFHIRVCYKKKQWSEGFIYSLFHGTMEWVNSLARINIIYNYTLLSRRISKCMLRPCTFSKNHFTNYKLSHLYYIDRLTGILLCNKAPTEIQVESLLWSVSNAIKNRVCVLKVFFSCVTSKHREKSYFNTEALLGSPMIFHEKHF